MALATMPSPPGNHPFMRPAISATPSPPGSLHQPGAAYYQSIANPNLAPPSADGRSASSRPASSLSATPSGPPRPLSAQTPRSTAGARFSVNGTPNGSTNGHAAPYREGPDVPRKLSRWEEKVQGDLAGWRGGHGAPRSSVPQAGVPNDTYYGQPTTGVIGRDLPKEIVRVERDWSLGDICQFSTVFPMELESRIAPAAFQSFVESINSPLEEAYSVSGAITDNLIAVLTWWTSLLWRTSHFEKELLRAEQIIREANDSVFNPAGLNVLSPRDVALQYLEIEYY